jgi:hypothetical protein
MLPPPNKIELDGAARPRNALAYGDGVSEASTDQGAQPAADGCAILLDAEVIWTMERLLPASRSTSRFRPRPSSHKANTPAQARTPYTSEIARTVLPLVRRSGTSKA